MSSSPQWHADGVRDRGAAEAARARPREPRPARGGDPEGSVDATAPAHRALTHAIDTLWMAYQPIVRWPTGEVFASEALVRSGEPTLPCPPVLFDVAVSLGRRGELGRAIRARVAHSASHVPGPGLIFVNLDPGELLDGALYLDDAPLTGMAHRVVLELTERSSLEDVPDVRARVAALRALGFRIAIDDLGAGYAGLSLLTLLEPDVVKLDQSLIRGIHDSPVQRQVVRSMATLCRELGVLLVAEGVETVAERDVLAAVGCTLLQGNLIARPSQAAVRPTPTAPRVG